MTDSFVSTFTDARGDGAPVPATFRRMGIEHFTASKTDESSVIGTTVRMPGLPGLEMQTREQDPRLRRIIQGFVNNAELSQLHEHRIENGRLIGRTIYPSIAYQESCVTCHNARFGEGTYQIGDVMGAYVVESDLTAITTRQGYYAIAAFIAAFFVFRALASRERNRMSNVLNGLRARVRLEQQKTAAEAQAKFLMSHDALTGLANRSMFRDHVQQTLNEQLGSGVMIALVDMDEFKAINDTLGHAAGDALLVAVAQRLTRLADTADGLVSRLGGDEFALVLRQNDVFMSPAEVGRCVLAAFEETVLFEGNAIQPQCSIGVALVDDIEQASPTELLKAADAALYAAKAAGRNLFQIYDEKIRISAGRRTKIAAELPGAIANHQIRVALQPKVCLSEGRLFGFEALARWKMGDEEIGPAEFIPIAEEIGLIRLLDLEVLRTAASFVADIEATSGLQIGLSTNISAQNFRLGGLTEAVLDILTETRLPAQRLTIEVTESTAVENWAAVKDVLTALRRHGVRISLDDFGTGYSSLSYLRLFGFEEIKIDREFITDISEDDETLFLFESIVEMATGLGSTVVVEGIETPQQAAIVAEKGAQIGQGYLYSKPMELDAVRTYLRQQTTAVA
ncbi:EAL domain-containing protein [Yoonia sp. F2084L]|uniref:putative bifunctional diguanylate cyclase/phosphodiesterase n=1 Tax=Yoonia sp. F2084L TaxID=2926419 RepID=UPI001FF37E99|nr:EAL domain-containing protein [Yoonia sp. F2084L]MCK0094635.1 EAL domain-containing protein [Yoonia sp. F2084L]